MTERQEKTKAMHEQGLNCAQCVVAALSDLYDADLETILAATGGFGGGMRCGEICGSVSGGITALGLIYGGDPADEKARQRIGKLTQEFTRRFRAEHGNIVCRELIAAAKERRCPIYISSAVGIVEQMAEDISKGDLTL